jgi:predicted nuclease of restriction endonuclease-like (RecB) superfamily
MQFEHAFIQDIKDIWLSSRQKAFTLVNRAMIIAYWEIGRRITEEEQKGYKRAEYGGFLLRELAKALTIELDKALDERELRRIRQFYQCFPIRDSLLPELSWSHYKLIISLDGEAARNYYMKEAAGQSWTVRHLDRNIHSMYFERIIGSHQDRPEPEGQIGERTLTADDLVKDPYLLEFLGIDIPTGFSESELETAIINKIQFFLLELGKGFAFVGRQYAIKTDTKLYYIDLVFYNIFLRCYCLIDLKISALSHQDIGQMDMYVRMWEALKKVEGDNPTIGIILCAEKDATLVKYSILDENKQLFASRYRMVLPSEDELIKEIEREKNSFNESKK